MIGPEKFRTMFRIAVNHLMAISDVRDQSIFRMSKRQKLLPVLSLFISIPNQLSSGSQARHKLKRFHLHLHLQG